MFSFIVLGDSAAAVDYFDHAGLSNIDQGDISKWEKQCTFQDNEIDLTLDVPLTDGFEYDEFLPMADGILYFLNPNFPEQFALFEDIVQIIQKINRNVPFALVFRDSKRLIQTSTNQLLFSIWEKYSFEAFIADLGSPNYTDYILESICESIITRQAIINLDTAWMQVPLLYSKVNRHINTQDWISAARLVEKIALISQKCKNSDWQIYAEQAAWLYAKGGAVLDASKIIGNFNEVYAERYKKIYVDQLIYQGRVLHNEKNFAQAAQQFETAGNWARFELSDSILIKKSLKNAIYSWISACEIQNAFSLLERFDHNEMIDILEEVTDKIAGVADFLTSQGQDDFAKAQLYLCFQKYQKAGLFDSIKVFANKTVKILKRILERHLRNLDVDSAKLTLDELYNIWETFGIESENIDSYLLRVGTLFIERQDFQKVEVILPKIESGEIKNQLSKARMDEEERIKSDLRQDELEDLTDAVAILKTYVDEEKKQILAYNSQVYQETQDLLEQKQISSGLKYIHQYFQWLTFIGESEFSYDVYERILSFYLTLGSFDKFIEEISHLPEGRRKVYLREKVSIIINSLNNLMVDGETTLILHYSTSIIKLYRNHLLYDESRDFAELLVKFLLEKSKTMAQQGILASISESIGLVSQVENISKMYLDSKQFDLDPIYSPIVIFYIKTADFKEARKYNERINSDSLKETYYSQIEEIVGEKSRSKAMEAQQKQEVQFFVEQLSQLRNLARDQRITSENLLRMRLGLRRRYFQKPIDLILKGEFPDAAQQYFEVAETLIKTKKFELAGISAGIGTILCLLVKNVSLLKNHLDKLNLMAGVSISIFKEIFSVKLIYYILKMIEINNPTLIINSLKLYESLALFPEEKMVLDTLLGKDIDFEALVHSDLSSRMDSGEIKFSTNHQHLIDKIAFDPSQRSKRNSIEQKFWEEAQNYLARQEYEQASLSYLAQVDHLVVRNNEKFAIISIVMAFLALLKAKKPAEVYFEYEKFYYQFDKKYERVAKSELFALLEIILQYWVKKSAQQTIRQILLAFQSKLPLFDWESSLISGFLGDFEGKGSQISSNTDKNVHLGSPDEFDDSTLQTQQIVVLTQEISDMQSNFAELLHKRNSMVNSYYKDIISYLTAESYLEAATEYEKLGKRMARRNDFNAASLMLLLSLLSRLKHKQSVNEITVALDTVLGKLGIVKKILDDHFGVKIAYFVLDVLKSKNENLKTNIRNLLQLLPLLSAEKVLVQLE
ncbi:hypothetical protein NEF87_003838 [Candidatus Lokiarchaeum ossiferum]|uniref:Tetratricopeptide repeat protein n=1 Tax=Candidatus Lokiarchaeum ossiferum TaxID=2951803 RepID=A0ABY6HW32_9ARCH|nr:hypothetical protein NEF87_003838 [Candidatus Lokiarchaeum sp. B-35]